jgi:hypothetical protein
MSDVPTRLLRDALRRTSAEPSASCLDAAALAAWADGSLGARERAAIESHAASCARCQALVAAMVKTEPPALPPRAWWTSKIAWLAPMAAAAAALVVWIAVPEQPRRAPAPAPLTANAVPAAPAPALPAPAAQITRPPEGAPVLSPPAASVAPLPPARSPVATERRQQPAEASKELRDASVAAAPPPASADTRIEAPSAVAAGAAAADVSARPPAAEARQLSEAAPRAAVESLRARSVTQNAAKAAAPLPFEIASPDLNVRWRVSGTNVQRTADAGVTWQAQSSGVRGVLASGAAPLSTVCWIVGVAGTVARSTDGQTWQRVAFPEAIDLRAVRASDGLHAVVTAADGRTFATDDGGQTWVH